MDKLIIIQDSFDELADDGNVVSKMNNFNTLTSFINKLNSNYEPIVTTNYTLEDTSYNVNNNPNNIVLNLVLVQVNVNLNTHVRPSVADRKYKEVVSKVNKLINQTV